MFPHSTRRRVGRREREALYALQQQKCMYCGRRLELAEMHIDHKRPVANNGSNGFANLQLLCAPCNMRKGTMTDGEFRRRFRSLGLAPARKVDGPPARPIPLSRFAALTRRRPVRRRPARHSRLRCPLCEGPLPRSLVARR